MLDSQNEGQLTILVVDDDEAVTDLIAGILLGEGHQVILVHSAEEALEQLPYFTFQVAFIDHHLPNMEGLVLGEYLLRNNPDMRVALVTGANDPQLRKLTGALEITYIEKPFEIGSLLEVIEGYKAMAKQRLQARLAQADPDFFPRLDLFYEGVTAYYRMPSVPSRIEGTLVARLKMLLNDLSNTHRYNERDRVLALAGLLTSQVLGIRLPRFHGRTMFDIYDELMRGHGRAPAFTEAEEGTASCFDDPDES